MINESIQNARVTISIIERIPEFARTWHEKTRLQYAKATVLEGEKVLKKWGAFEY